MKSSASPTKSRRGEKRVGLALLVAVGFGACDHATAASSLKSVMSEMAATTKQAKSALTGGDPSVDGVILRAYAEEAKTAASLFPGSSAREQDLRSRFLHFAATANAARQAPPDAAKFRATFGAIVNACRSCHSVYK